MEIYFKSFVILCYLVTHIDALCCFQNLTDFEDTTCSSDDVMECSDDAHPLCHRTKYYTLDQQYVYTRYGCYDKQMRENGCRDNARLGLRICRHTCDKDFCNGKVLHSKKNPPKIMLQKDNRLICSNCSGQLVGSMCSTEPQNCSSWAESCYLALHSDNSMYSGCLENSETEYTIDMNYVCRTFLATEYCFYTCRGDLCNVDFENLTYVTALKKYNERDVTKLALDSSTSYQYMYIIVGFIIILLGLLTLCHSCSKNGDDDNSDDIIIKNKVNNNVNKENTNSIKVKNVVQINQEVVRTPEVPFTQTDNTENKRHLNKKSTKILSKDYIKKSQQLNVAKPNISSLFEENKSEVSGKYNTKIPLPDDEDHMKAIAILEEKKRNRDEEFDNMIIELKKDGTIERMKKETQEIRRLAKKPLVLDGVVYGDESDHKAAVKILEDKNLKKHVEFNAAVKKWRKTKIIEKSLINRISCDDMVLAQPVKSIQPLQPQQQPPTQHVMMMQPNANAQNLQIVQKMPVSQNQMVQPVQQRIVTQGVPGQALYRQYPQTQLINNQPYVPQNYYMVQPTGRNYLPMNTPTNSLQ